MTSEEFYAIDNDPGKTLGEKLTAWMAWCKAFDEREAERKEEMEHNIAISKEYEL